VVTVLESSFALSKLLFNKMAWLQPSLKPMLVHSVSSNQRVIALCL